MNKRIIISFLISLFFIFSGTSYAAENPFNGLMQEQIIQKYFEGKQLDLIEGIWLDDNSSPVFIIKAGSINYDNKENYDYFKVENFTSSNAKIIGVRKTQYSSCFEQGKAKALLRFVSPTSLQIYAAGYYSHPLYSFYTRIYPSELK